MADSFQSDVWDLRVSTRSVIDASSAWLGLKAGLESTADQLAGSVSSVREVWDTPMATSYFEHVPGLIEALRAAAGVCAEVSTTLDHLVTDVMGAQSALSVSLHRLQQQMPAIDLGGTIIFLPQDDADHELLAEEAASARGIRRQARGVVGAAQAVVRGASTRVASLRSPWSAIASTGAPRWDAPIGTWVATSTMLDLGGSTLITGTSSDDVITVGIDPATGETIVTVGDVVHRVPRGQPVVINAGDGNDRITVPTGSTVHLRFLGGAGTTGLAAVHPSGPTTTSVGRARTASRRARATTSSAAGPIGTTWTDAAATTGCSAATATTSSTGWAATTPSTAAPGTTTWRGPRATTRCPVATARTRSRAAGATTLSSVVAGPT